MRPGKDGLTLTREGEGYAVFEVRTPYVIVPIVGRMEATADDREASVVEIDGSGLGLSISLDHGLTWKEVWKEAARVARTFFLERANEF